jgi:hypothetical protein
LKSTNPPIIINPTTMAISDSPTKTSPAIEVGPDDILFECPACDKSLVVDQSAEGLTVSCPQCHTNLIVPPKTPPPAKPPQSFKPSVPPPSQPQPSPAKEKPETTEPASTSTVVDVPVAGNPKSLQGGMASLSGKLKELQTQRTELTNRMATRLNEINRDLVMLARLETSQQQVISELSQLAAQLASIPTDTSQPSAPPAAGRTRVTFQV